MNVACSHCGKPIEVTSLLEAGQQPCPSCGHIIIGGGDPSPAGASTNSGVDDLLQMRPRKRRNRVQLLPPSAWAAILIVGIVLYVQGGGRLTLGIIAIGGIGLLFSVFAPST